MNPNQALWEKGDFTRIAQSMRESGEALVGSLGIQKGLTVLDLGCGDGTTALPAARLGAEVLGVDVARNLVEAFGSVLAATPSGVASPVAGGGGTAPGVTGDAQAASFSFSRSLSLGSKSRSWIVVPSVRVGMKSNRRL
jgi:SAM-dependent methyltransferase